MVSEQIEFARIFLVLLLAGLSSLTDLKTGLIYNKITYPGIVLGVLLNFLEPNFLGLITGVIVFVFFYLFYFFGGIGGGDVKLFTAATLLMPFYKGFPFVLPVLFFSAVSSVIVLSSYFFFKTLKERPIIIKKRFFEIIFFVLIFVLFLFLFFQLKIINFLSFIVLGASFVFAAPYIALKKDIQERFFLRNISVSELEEDEIIAREFLEKKNLKKNFFLKGIITEKDKKKLVEMGVKTVPVYRGLPPFAPFFLLGTVLTLFFPELFFNAFAPVFV